MFVAESRRSRRLVGRLDRGSDVISALTDLCRKQGVHAAEIRAQGSLEEAALVEFDQRGRAPRAPRRFASALEILHLHGSAAEEDGKLVVQARVALSRERDNGIELLGGQLVSGRVHTLEFVIEVFDDLVLRRETDAATGVRGWVSATEVAATSKPAAAQQWEAPARLVAVDHVPEAAPAPTTWQDVMAAKPEPEPTPAATGDAPQIAPGDFIDHPKFGRCQVERIEGDHEFVSARMRNQRLIRLSLDVLSLVAVGTEAGHRVFKPERP